jgi:hypothetical protein
MVRRISGGKVTAAFFPRPLLRKRRGDSIFSSRSALGFYDFCGMALLRASPAIFSTFNLLILQHEQQDSTTFRAVSAALFTLAIAYKAPAQNVENAMHTTIGYITAEGQVENSSHTTMGYYTGLPVSISIEPTTACNLRCPECPSGLRSFTRPHGQSQTGPVQAGDR